MPCRSGNRHGWRVWSSSSVQCNPSAVHHRRHQCVSCSAAFSNANRAPRTIPADIVGHPAAVCLTNSTRPKEPLSRIHPAFRIVVHRTDTLHHSGTRPTSDRTTNGGRSSPPRRNSDRLDPTRTCVWYRRKHSDKASSMNFASCNPRIVRERLRPRRHFACLACTPATAHGFRAQRCVRYAH